MDRGRGVAAVAALCATVVLTGCATDRQDKPALTAAAVTRIARQCGAVGSAFHRDRDAAKLPYANFTTDGPLDGPAGQCIGRALSAYRYAMFGVRDRRSSAD